MPNYEVTSPDGRTFRVTAPEGATHDQIIGYARAHMPAPTLIDTQKNVARGLGETGIGAAESAISGLGLPVDIINRLIHPSFGLPASPRPLPQVPGGSAQISDLLDRHVFGNPKTPQDVEARRAGSEMLFAVRPSGASAAMEVAPKIFPGEAAKPLAKYLPGSMARAEETVKGIGPVSDEKMSNLGDAMMNDLRGRFDKMVEARATAANEAEKKLGGFWKNNPEAVEAARKRAFREASADVNKFNQQNALGKKIAGNLSKYSDVPSVSHSSIPSAAFKDAQRVRDLRELLGGDQTQVEKYAGEYAATKLQSAVDSVKPPIGKPRLPGSTIANMARAAENWQKANAGWLDEVPVTKAAVQFSVDQLKASARAASNTRAVAVGAGALAALYEMGSNAAYWIRYAASKL